MSNTKQKIELLKTQLEELEKQLEREKALDPKIKQLAIQLHTSYCYSNHTDGCWWEYENDSHFVSENRFSARSEYYRWAQRISKHCDIDTVVKILKTLKDTRYGKEK